MPIFDVGIRCVFLGGDQDSPGLDMTGAGSGETITNV